MRPVIFIVTILLLTLGIQVITKFPETNYISILIDITDTDIPLPQEEDIEPYFDLLHDPYGGVVVTVSPIHEYWTAPVETITLPPVPMYMRNSLLRKKEIEAFKEKIMLTIRSVSDNAKPHEYSLIYRRITEALESLPIDQPGTVLVFSDFMERSGTMDSYENILTAENIKNHYLLDPTGNHQHHTLHFITSFRSSYHALQVHETSEAFKDYVETLKGIFSLTVTGV